MKIRGITLGGFFLTIFLQFSFSQNDVLPYVIKSGEVPVKLAEGFAFTEGPAADRAGNVFFTDQPNDRIMIWSTDGKLSTFMQPSGNIQRLSSMPAETSGRVRMRKMNSAAFILIKNLKCL